MSQQNKNTLQIPKTPLAKGNYALRTNQFPEAIRQYVKILLDTPDFAKIITGNLAIARKKYRAYREGVQRQRVGVCGWELSHNAASRVYTLAMLYETVAEVEIIGSIFPKWGRDIWEPIRDTEITKHSFVVEAESSFMAQAIELVANHPYDVVHLSKPRIPNIFFGILYKLIWDAKVLMDIDAEELAFVDEEAPISVDDFLKEHGKLPELKCLAGKDWTRLAVGLAKEFDGVTVSNSALQQRYGGEIIRHARDEKLFQPSPELRCKSREKFGIPQNKKVVFFLGTPCEYNGMIETAKAIATLNRKDILYVIVGDFSDIAFKKKLQEVKDCNFLFFPNQPFKTIPELVAIADCCVLIQDDKSLTAQFQTPEKLSDALGMGVPVIMAKTESTHDMDICVKTDSKNLASNILSIIENSKLAKDNAIRCLTVFKDKFSYSVNQPKIEKMVQLTVKANHISAQLQPLINICKASKFIFLTIESIKKTTSNNTCKGKFPRFNKYNEQKFKKLLDLPILISENKYHGHVESIIFVDYILTVNGWILNRDYPGLPTRLNVFIGNHLRHELIAIRPTKSDSNDELKSNSFEFTFKLTISESEIPQRVSIRSKENSVELFRFSITDYYQTDTFGNTVNNDINIQSDNDIIIGNVEHCSLKGVTGWALSKTNPTATVELILFINEKIFSVVQCTTYREDVKALHGGHGCFGFSFELPPIFTGWENLYIKVRPTAGINKINKSDQIIHKGFANCYLSTRNVNWAVNIKQDSFLPKKISVIILNRNGSKLLSDMLKSVVKYEKKSSTEWIVVDHDSIDDSEVICKSFSNQGLDINFIQRGGNYSFSSSNNYGAQIASGDLLVFANNDLIFVEEILNEVLNIFSDYSIGAAGVKLLDYIESQNYSSSSLLPAQHLGVYFHRAINNGWIRPYEARSGKENVNKEKATVEVPVVTAAFIAIRASDFNKIGGFSEDYYYGLEDVDLCLRVQKILGKKIVSINEKKLIHHRGFSRGNDKLSQLRRKTNNLNFTTTWKSYLRYNIRCDVFKRYGFWTGVRPTVGFIVTDAGNKTSAGEYYTASELGTALQKHLPINVRYITENDWYNLDGIDVVVVMVNRFNLHKVKSASPFLLSINWTRQWFDRWADDNTLYSYDYVLASSNCAATFLTEKTGINVHVLPIAANTNVFGTGIPVEEYRCDYVFTGSKFGIAREIEFQLDPATIQGKGIVFGYNWEGTKFEKMCKGPVAYTKLPNIYASTRIVLDDANVATKPWGSCNSRVFDALASGCLLITNGKLGTDDLFNGLVPTFESKETLTKELNYWIANEPERLSKVIHLQDFVRKHHSYDNRAKRFIEIIQNIQLKLRISIKCSAKYSERNQWGDFHFANSLASALRDQGFVVRVDCREAWNSGIANSDDIVIALRGLVAYKPSAHQINILWIISHPDLVSTSEIESYDHVYVASEYYSNNLKSVTDVPIEFAPQCVDVSRFGFKASNINRRSDRILFVGNSRGIFRESVCWAIENQIDISVYGVGWEPFIDTKYINGQNVPNEILSELYSSSRLVLCDHWEDMRKLGFVSNRIFDVLSCGGILVTDNVEGIKTLIPQGIKVYNNQSEFIDILNGEIDVSLAERQKMSNWVLQNHSFDCRALAIKKVILSLHIA